jgi:protein-S-isoprenylcysteine O-methyltransferase Ste14
MIAGSPAPRRRTRSLCVPPVVATLGVALPMWLVARISPALAVGLPGHLGVACVFVAAGAAVSLAGVAEFRRVRTTVSPLRPEKASVLVTSGVFRWTRNPMYLGLALALFGWAAYLAHPLAALGVPAFVVWMSRWQIPREERALEGLFGEEFARYRARVRRWL